MFRTLSQGVGFALSLLTLASTAVADGPFPAQCWPNCYPYLLDLECQNWFGPTWYYCGYNLGWVYCCSPPG
jgi:hypothetical protein